MRVISARGSYIDVPPTLYRNEEPNGPPLLGGFSDLPLSLAKYSRINLTVVPESSFGSYDREANKYDGIIGSLQANRSDYSLIPTTIDFSGFGDNRAGVVLKKILSQQIYKLASSPNQNTTTQSLSVHQLFLVLDHQSFTSMIISFVIFVCWFKLLCNVLYLLLKKKECRRLKLKHSNISWYIFCCLTRQSLPSQVPITRSHQEMIFVVRFMVLLLVYIIFSGMSADIVIFTPPPLIRTLQELLSSNKIIVFDSASQIADIMGKSSPGSEMNQVYAKAMKQSLLTGQNPVIDASKSENFVSLVPQVTDQNRAYLGLEVAIKIFRAFHCINHRKSSKFFESDTSYHKSMMGLFFHEFASKELMDRVERTYDRAMAGGLFQMQKERAPEVGTSLFGEPSISCLNEYEWDQTTVNGVQSYTINLYIPILQFLILLMILSFALLVLEFLQFIAQEFKMKYF